MPRSAPANAAQAAGPRQGTPAIDKSEGSPATAPPSSGAVRKGRDASQRATAKMLMQSAQAREHQDDDAKDTGTHDEHAGERSHDDTQTLLAAGAALSHAPGTDAAATTDAEAAPSWLTEARQHMKLAWPVIASIGCRLSFGIVALMYLGHVPGAAEVDLAAAALANMLLNVTGFSIGQGFASAIDTLCSQANGANNKMMLGLVTQRGILILGLLCIPIGAMWLCTEPLLLATGQEPRVAHLAAVFVWWQLPTLWPALAYEAINRYLQAQGVVLPSLAVSVVTACIHPIMLYILIDWAELGFVGGPIAVSLTNLFLLGGLIAYILWSRIYVDTWPPVTRACLQEWGTFLALGLPGTVMLCAEWWALEIVALGAGWLGAVQLATQGIVLNTVELVFIVPLGVGIAGAVRIGNYLGAGKPQLASRAAILTVVLGVLLACLESILLLALHNQWGAMFTPSVVVQDLVSHVLLLALGVTTLDGLKAAQGGVLRGCGHQRVGAISNAVAYAIFGLPAGFALAFYAGIGIYGLYVGLIIALIVQNTPVLIYVLRIDWAIESIAARRRVGASSRALAAQVELPANTGTALTVEV